MTHIRHWERERLAAQLTNPMRTALLTGGIHPGYGNSPVTGNTNTIVALIDRGLITTGAKHYWTRLGREVARLAFGSNVVHSLDELHAEAWAEDRARFLRKPREQPEQISQIERWLARHGVAIVTAVEVIAARDADHAEAIDENLRRNVDEAVAKARAASIEATRAEVTDRIVQRYAIRPGQTFRATVVTQAEYGRAYDALMSATGTDVALRAALAALGMSVRQS